MATKNGRTSKIGLGPDYLLVLGWIRSSIHEVVKNIPVEIQLICKEFFGINSFR